MIRNLNTNMRMDIIRFIQKRAANVPSETELMFMCDNDLIDQLKKSHALFALGEGSFLIIPTSLVDSMNTLTRSGIK